MQWLSADFAQERRWKRGVARKVCLQLGLLPSIFVSGLLFLDGWKGTKHNSVGCLQMPLVSRGKLWLHWILGFDFSLCSWHGERPRVWPWSVFTSFPQVVRMVIRHHEEQRQKEERARREEQAKLRRIASAMAKDVRQFWSNVEKVGSRDWEREMLWV